MNLLEYAAKTLVLTPAGIATLPARLCATPEEAAAAVAALGPAMVKAQVPTGKRGKAGGIRPADSAEQAEAVARDILAMTIDGHRVFSVLVEQRATIAREYYVAVLCDPVRRTPLVLFSPDGGVEIEATAARAPARLRRHEVDLLHGFTRDEAEQFTAGLDLHDARGAVVDVLVRLYDAFVGSDAELVEINPLAVLVDGRVVALDAKVTLDDAAAFRQPVLAAAAAAEPATELERRGAAAGLKFLQFDGNVGVLANGAGLTMTTMDVIRHYGGRPANFLEIGGEAYTKSEIALGLVLDNPGVKSLVVNFCGAFARTDVMAAGVVQAWHKLNPSVPVFFSIHGTGEDEAIRLVREQLGIEPFDLMEDAVKAAVEAAS
ncbi:acetate--CoA ligase family protein [Rhodopseudomonas sp. HC1]|uniref:ATP-grasp domain-containing protein n=1 Tax=Rhodopseudomonas infernalis TaxID=2897386 RepID=UPI001EE8B558|nr:ATP-grasp domain-containing protein [Rhodopseudomonas infernalis]MCG6203435.1 acetate--CoA ligase family protein [Rhodopseudomonas infernalis]